MMTQSRDSRPVSATTSNAKALAKSRSTVAAIHDTDAAITRMRESIPEQPYILSIPLSRSNEYRHYAPHEAESWRRHAPFEPHEEHLQYMSFVLRDNVDSCFVIKTMAEEERERKARVSADGGISGSGTPLSTGPKKKISLADWKNKKSAEKKPAGSEDTTAPKAPTVNGVHVIKEKSAGAADQSSQRDARKRPHSSLSQVSNAHDDGSKSMSQDAQSQKRIGEATAPAAKKARTTSPSPSLLPALDTSKVPHGLPALQSPIKVDAAPHNLPVMLSPTLPEAIEDELLRRTNDSSQSSTQSSAEKLQKHNAPSQAAKRPRTDHAKARDDTVSIMEGNENRSAHDSIRNRKSDLAVKSYHDDAFGPPLLQSRLIVKLRYSRQLRKHIMNLLRLPSRPSIKSRPRSPDDQIPPEAPNGDNRANSSLMGASTSSGSKPPKENMDKRKRPNEDIQPVSKLDAKRQKLASDRTTAKNPRTPDQAATPSPAASAQASKLKGTRLHPNDTPRKELLAPQMSRTRSTESNEAAVSMGNGSTPSVARPTSTPVNRHPDCARWLALGQRYSNLGRKLKHEFQDLMHKTNANESERKKAASCGIQSLLCYVLYFHCSDASARLENKKPGLSNSWMMCVPLWTQYSSAVAGFPLLEGLHYHIGLVIRNRISQIIGERMKANAKGEAAAERESRTSNGDAPTPTPSIGSSGNPLTNLPSVDVIGQNLTELHRYALQGSAKLSVQDLLKYFPKSWAEQTAVRSATPRDGQVPTRLLEGSWYLPIGMDTSPIQCVRASVKLLQEWITANATGLELAITKL